MTAYHYSDLILIVEYTKLQLFPELHKDSVSFYCLNQYFDCYCFNQAFHLPESDITYSRTEHFLQNTLAVFVYNHFNRELEACHVLAGFAVEQLQNNHLL